MRTPARKAPLDNIGNVKGRIYNLREIIRRNLSVEDEGDYLKEKAKLEKKILTLKKKLRKPTKDTLASKTQDKKEDLLSVLDNL